MRSSGEVSSRGFTMVEIAIALAVIGFALVAIIGILPTGLEAQKQTRERSIINQEAKYFMDLIKGDVLDVGDLVQFAGDVTVVSVFGSNVYDAGTDFNNSFELMGLLVNSNAYAEMVVRAISSPAVSRGPSGNELAFRYRLAVTMAPAISVSSDHPDLPQLETRLFDIGLDFEWPVLPNGNVGRGRASYRGMVSGLLTNDPPGSDFYFFLR